MPPTMSDHQPYDAQVTYDSAYDPTTTDNPAYGPVTTYTMKHMIMLILSMKRWTVSKTVHHHDYHQSQLWSITDHPTTD